MGQATRREAQRCIGAVALEQSATGRCVLWNGYELRTVGGADAKKWACDPLSPGDCGTRLRVAPHGRGSAGHPATDRRTGVRGPVAVTDPKRASPEVPRVGGGGGKPDSGLMRATRAGFELLEPDSSCSPDSGLIQI